MPVPDFILRLRERVGHDLLWLPGVTAVVLRDGQEPKDPELLPGTEVLLVKRADNGRWGPVTGIVEPGEHPADCAVRDLPRAEAHRPWRDAAEAAVEAAGATILGKGAPRLPNTLFLSVAGWDSPQQLIVLDLDGVMVSAGSACSSGKTKPSRAIVAMGRMDLATGGVRVSGGWGTTEDDWKKFADAWVKAWSRQRERAAERAKEVA